MTKGPFCPSCSKPATGNFCQHCGTKLGGRFCNQCGAKVSPAAKFCNQCGNRMEAGAGAGVSAAVGAQNLPWWIAGAALFVLIAVVGVRMVQPGEREPPSAGDAPAAGAAGTGAGPAAVDLSSMTPREAAERLYTRVMTAVTQGDSAQAQAFLPMAVAAYERARPLDLDGLFHLSLLNQTASDFAEALAVAEEILAQDANHILGLGAAAEALVLMDRGADAEARYRQLLEHYDAELARGLAEYAEDAHRNIVESMKRDAEAFLAGR